MVGAGGAVIGQRQMHGCRLARLQRAVQVHRVARRVAFGDARVAAERPGRDADIGDGGGDLIRAQSDVGSRGGTGAAQHNLKLFGTLHQAVADRTQIDHQVGHRVAVAGVGQLAGAGIEAQIGACADRRSYRRCKVCIVGAGGADVGNCQVNGSGLARLQRAVQMQRVVRRVAFGDRWIAADRPGRHADGVHRQRQLQGRGVVITRRVGEGGARYIDGGGGSALNIWCEVGGVLAATAGEVTQHTAGNGNVTDSKIGSGLT